MAVHVLGPVLMTELLRPTLRESDGPRVLMVTSGGMYGQPLRADDPEYVQDDYSPTTAYARSKRAQVELLPLLAAPLGHRGRARLGDPSRMGGHARRRRVAAAFQQADRPDPAGRDGGADTTVWLSAVEPAPPGGGLWHDRRRRPTSYLPRTRPRPGDVDRMWSWVAEQTGVTP